MSADRSLGDVRRVLVFRRGSLGDTLIALPSLNLLRRRFPHAEIRLLTVSPQGGLEVGAEQLLDGTGLVDSYASYPVRTRDWRTLLAVARAARAWRPDVAVHLAEPVDALAVWRELLFLHLCGARHVVGAPLSAGLRRHRPLGGGVFESEAARLARCLEPLGDARLTDRESWSPRLHEGERLAARAALAEWSGSTTFVAFGPGAKAAEKDWGEARWHTALAGLGAALPGVGLALLGASGDRPRAARLARAWPGPTLNLCGQLPVRHSAAVLAEAAIYFGHDGGLMHLAAAVATPTVCVFGRAAPPGVWFAAGPGHRSLYPEGAVENIGDIDPALLIRAAIDAFAGRRPGS